MTPKEILNNTAIPVQLPYIAGHSLKKISKYRCFPPFSYLKEYMYSQANSAQIKQIL